MSTTTATKWTLDAAHSEIGFKAKHLMITTVSGKFEKFSASVETSKEDFSDAIINFSADTASVNTGSPDRDKHLIGADFFDSEKHPQLTFTGTKLEHVKDDKYTLIGNLSIRGVNKPVHLGVEFAGVAKDPWGNTKAGFVIDGKIARKDWGLTWNVALEQGGLLVSEDIKIHCEVQFSMVG